MSNILKVKIDENKLVVATDSLWQYDYGQILIPEGDLPESYEVHFGNYSNTGETIKIIKRIGSPDGVIIPNDLLKTGLDVYAYIVVHVGQNDGQTICCIHIPVKERSKPSNL